MAMKVVRQARLELSGGSTPDQLRPPSFLPESPRREVVRSSAGTGVVYPPFFGVIRVAYPKA